jgi:hypothetical protein
MHDQARVNVAEQSVPDRGIRHIAHDEFRRLVEVGRPFPGRVNLRVKVVEYHPSFSARGELTRESAADEACSAGHQNGSDS